MQIIDLPYTLKSGLKVILIESRSIPLIALQMWVNNGSANEKPGQEGFSHFIEHILFRGTHKYPGGIGEVIKKSGGYFNAITSLDYTGFFITVSKDQLETGLECMAELMHAPLFDKNQINKERKVVIEEIKGTLDQPEIVSFTNIMSAVFGKHQYGAPVLGNIQSIKKAPVAVLRKYFESWYTPANMTLVLAGDLGGPATERLVNQYLGAKSGKRPPRRPRLPVINQEHIRYEYLKPRFQESQLKIGFPGAKITNPDAAALEILAAILAQGDGSRVALRLQKQSSISDIVARSYSLAETGLFEITLYPNTTDGTQAMATLAEEVARLLRVPVSAEELDRARLSLEAAEYAAMQTLDDIAGGAGRSQILNNNPRYAEKYIVELHKLTPARILKAARRHLRPQNCTLVYMPGLSDEKKLSRSALRAMVDTFGSELTSALREKPAPRPTKKKTSPAKARGAPVKRPLARRPETILRYSLPHGGIAVIRTTRAVPLIALKASYRGGVNLESSKDTGLTRLLASSWPTGTKTHSEAEVAMSIEGSGGALTPGASLDHVELSLETLSRCRNRSLETFADVFLNPLFGKEEVLREAEIQIENIRARRDDPVSLATQLFRRNIFADHHYGLDPLGTEAGLRKLSAEKVRAHWHMMISSSTPVFAASGDVNPDELLKFFEGLSPRLDARKPRQPAPLLAPLKTDKTVFHKSNKEQTHVIVGFRTGPAMDSLERLGVEVLNEVLGGPAGRFYEELRERSTLAYRISTFFEKRIEAGAFGVHVACSPENSKEAISLVTTEFRRLADNRLTELQVMRAKTNYIVKLSTRLQRVEDQAAALLQNEIFGIDQNESFKVAEHLSRITPEVLRDLAVRLFKAPRITAIVGPRQT